MRLGQYQNCRN